MSAKKRQVKPFHIFTELANGKMVSTRATGYETVVFDTKQKHATIEVRTSANEERAAARHQELVAKWSATEEIGL